MSDRTDPYHLGRQSCGYCGAGLVAGVCPTCQRDPYQLGLQFFGGVSKKKDIKFPGLIHRVKRELRASFRDPLPSSGGQRGDILQLGGSKGHDSYCDPGPLRDYLRDWLEEFGFDRHREWLASHPPMSPMGLDEFIGPKRKTEEDKSGGLVGMATGRVRVFIGQIERSLITDAETEGVLGLQGAFASFLAIGGCEHSLATTQDGATVCPSCGLTEVA